MRTGSRGRMDKRGVSSELFSVSISAAQAPELLLLGGLGGACLGPGAGAVAAGRLCGASVWRVGRAWHGRRRQASSRGIRWSSHTMRSPRQCTLRPRRSENGGLEGMLEMRLEGRMESAANLGVHWQALHIIGQEQDNNCRMI